MTSVTPEAILDTLEESWPGITAHIAVWRNPDPNGDKFIANLFVQLVPDAPCFQSIPCPGRNTAEAMQNAAVEGVTQLLKWPRIPLDAAARLRRFSTAGYIVQ